MSTAAFPGSYPSLTLVHPTHRRTAALAPVVRRRPTMRQGVALEVLGHAVEYLVDQQRYRIDGPARRGEDEAIRLLMRASREVFGSCVEIVPLHRRVSAWLHRRVMGSAG